MIFRQLATVEVGFLAAARVLILSCLAAVTPLSLAAAASQPSYTLIDAAFYSGAFIVLLVCFLINGAIKNLPGIYYTIMFLLGLLFVWAIDGGLIAVGLSGAARMATIWTLALTATAFSFFTAISAFDASSDLKKTKLIVVALAVSSILLIPFAWFMEGSWIAYVTATLFSASIACHVISTSTWKHLDETNQSTSLVTASIGLALVGLYVASAVTGIGRDLLFSLDAAKVAFGTILIPTLIAVIIALADVRLDRDRALEEALETARRDAETNANLLELEKQYARARDAASTRSRQLMSASHDIGQPLASMRAELDALQVDLPDTSLQRMQRVLDHMESLTRSLSQSGSAPVEAGLHGEVETETVELNLLFGTLDRLFKADAASEGITLNVQAVSGAVTVSPLILIRILSNIVSNAIRHSKGTQITLTADPDGTQMRLTVKDNGIGFDGKDIASAMQAGEKGDESDGMGLGLSIVSDLAESYHMPMQVSSDQSGTVFSILVPLAPD